jgi:hypothetical protein
LDEGFDIDLREAYPKADLIYVSTTGNIAGTELSIEDPVSTAILFSKTKVKVSSTCRSQHASSHDTGKALVSGLLTEGLKHILLFTDGLVINPSSLIRGINETIPAQVSLTGGVAGDAWEFGHTLVGHNNVLAKDQCVAVGLYGEAISVSYGIGGTWDSFGADRIVTRAKNNVLYELDGKPALELYHRYLGKYAEGHPRAYMFFPLGLRSKSLDNTVARSIISKNEEEQALILAGEVENGDRVRLMKANTERLLDGATEAAIQARQANRNSSLAILVSCVGRQEVLGQRTEEELEEAQQALGENTLLTGFYSYGEFAPISNKATKLRAELHNQTMAITVLSEE